jgi:hypothetical protein
MASVAVLALVLPASASASTTVYHLNFSGRSAVANYQDFGCPYTLLTVTANEGMSSDRFSGHIFGSVASIGIYQVSCSGATIFSGQTTVDVSHGEFKIDHDLGQTARHVTAPITSYSGTTTRTVDVTRL